MIESAEKSWLQRRFGGRVRFDVPMADYTAFRIGGPADVLVEPQNKEELGALLQWAQQSQIAHLTLGGGTNVLIRDGGIRGLVILMGRLWADLKWHRHQGQVLVTAKAGAPTRRICALALKHAWDGANFALGIPGSIGGAVLMNAGTQNGCTADVLQSVTIMTPEGSEVILDRSAMRSRYRQLELPIEVTGGTPESVVLVAATLCLAPGDRERIRRQAIKLMRARVQRQPTWKPSAGCFFKNPSRRMPAGRLIETLGLKGMKVGRAQISSRHANFIINRGGATAKDVLSLMAHIQERAMARRGIELTPEVRIVGQEKDNATKSA